MRASSALEFCRILGISDIVGAVGSVGIGNESSHTASSISVDRQESVVRYTVVLGEKRNSITSEKEDDTDHERHTDDRSIV